jgi:transposase-like protein
VTQAIARDPIYRRRRFRPEIIELCVRWYLTYRLSYRDLVEMMAEQGVTISHSTILRWVHRYVPEFEKRWARYAHLKIHLNARTLLCPTDFQTAIAWALT